MSDRTPRQGRITSAKGLGTLIDELLEFSRMGRTRLCHGLFPRLRSEKEAR